jgi:tRNA isopentenyl-2-thiomethyl-A-37 hydroxylase MiaE
MGVLESEADSSKAREHFRAYLTLAPRGERAAEVRRRLSELAIQEGEARSVRNLVATPHAASR